MDADAVELRVLGSLLEKQRTTPDQYPLSLNALRLACNQSTNRDPVVDYDERTIHEALQRLARRSWTRLASGAGSRAVKYRQLFEDVLGLADDEVAILTVLMLRGPQTPGELKQRTERMHRFGGLDGVHETLEELAERDLVERLGRRPGQKEDRYRHLLGGADPALLTRSEEATDAPRSETGAREEHAPLEARLERLEDEVAELRRLVLELHDPMQSEG